MIKYIHIKNFKSLVDTHADLGQLNVFVGNNGSGKTSFFKAIGFLRSLVAEDSINSSMELKGESFNDLVSLRADTKSIDFHLRVVGTSKQATEVDASVEIGIKKRRFAYVHSEKVLPWGLHDSKKTPDEISEIPYFVYRFARSMIAQEEGSRPITFGNTVLPHSILRDVYQQVRLRESSHPFELLSTVARQILGYRHFEIWGPQSLRQPAKGLTTILSGDGSNLASSLHSLRKFRREDFNSLLKDMSEAYPWLEDIEFRQTVERSVSLAFVEKAKLSVKSKDSKKYLPSQVSDGFLRMLALCSLKYIPPAIKTIAYEEPENGLHPKMIEFAAKALRSISERGVQVLVSTHSPLFLTAIFEGRDADEVANEMRLVIRDRNGETSISPPDSEVIESAFSQGVSIGDLWSMLLGESSMVRS